MKHGPITTEWLDTQIRYWLDESIDLIEIPYDRSSNILFSTALTRFYSDARVAERLSFREALVGVFLQPPLSEQDYQVLETATIVAGRIRCDACVPPVVGRLRNGRLDHSDLSGRNAAALLRNYLASLSDGEPAFAAVRLLLRDRLWPDVAVELGLRAYTRRYPTNPVLATSQFLDDLGDAPISALASIVARVLTSDYGHTMLADKLGLFGYSFDENDGYSTGLPTTLSCGWLLEALVVGDAAPFSLFKPGDYALDGSQVHDWAISWRKGQSIHLTDNDPRPALIVVPRTDDLESSDWSFDQGAFEDALKRAYEKVAIRRAHTALEEKNSAGDRPTEEVRMLLRRLEEPNAT